MFFKRGDKKNGSKKKNGKYMQMEKKCCGLTEVFFLKTCGGAWRGSEYRRKSATI
jgi:hypothetical protein